MALEQKDKELVAIGASIGAGCGPCLAHHVLAGRQAGLSEAQLARAVEVAEAAHRVAVELLAGHSRELVHEIDPPTPTSLHRRAPTSRAGELVGLGVTIGSNCHPLIEERIARSLEQGLDLSQARSAVKMAQIVQRHATEITAGKAAAVMGAADARAVTV